MNGIASLLDQAASQHVERLWRELETDCGLVGVRVTPFPHFSWQVTEGYDLPRLKTTLQKTARGMQPFVVHTAGLGLFTGESPVIYVPIVREKSLLRLHEMLWERTKKLAIRPASYYAPDQWIPHITLAYGDVDMESLGCALRTLAVQSFDWEIKVDNFVFVAQADDQVAETHTYPFGG